MPSAPAGGVDISCELRFEGVDRRESDLITHAADEFKCDVPTVLRQACNSIAVGRRIDQVRFQRSSVGVKRRAIADVGGGHELAAVGQHRSACVDTILRQQLIREDVGGGEPDCPAASIAAMHGARQVVRTIEDAGCIANPTVGQQPSRQGAAGTDDGLIGERDLTVRDNLDIKVESLAERSECLDAAGTSGAEPKVRAFDNDDRVEREDRVPDECFRRQAEEFLAGEEADDLVRAERAESCGSLFKRGESAGSFGRAGRRAPQNHGGMGIEREHRDSLDTREACRCPDKVLMADMDTVEVPDEHGGLSISGGGRHG